MLQKRDVYCFRIGFPSWSSVSCVHNEEILVLPSLDTVIKLTAVPRVKLIMKFLQQKISLQRA